MKKLNNKGFAISTILFSVLVIFVSVLILSYSVLMANPDKKPSDECPNGCNNPNCICPEKYEEKCSNEFIIGSEHFCTLYSDNTNVVALAKYNLNLGRNKSSDTEEGLQSEKTKNHIVGYVPVMNDAYVNNGNYGFYNLINKQSNISKYNSINLPNIDTIKSGTANQLRAYLDNYELKLKSLGIASINVRLLNINDLSDENNFKNCVDVYGKKIVDYNSQIDDHDNNSFSCVTDSSTNWLFWTNYWSGIVNKSTSPILYAIKISKSGSFEKALGGTTDDVAGIRPVIEISKSDFDRLPKA